jgi:CheY-like chemotaxis protein
MNDLSPASAATVRLDGTPIRDDGSGVRRIAAATLTEFHGRFLLAEDNPDSRSLIEHVLRKAGARVTVAENGQIALITALREQQAGRSFALIFMEMHMPIMDGYEATQKLRRANCTTPIVALIDNAVMGGRQRCTEAGCDDCVFKPVDEQRLVAAIKRWAGEVHKPMAPDIRLADQILH